MPMLTDIVSNSEAMAVNSTQKEIADVLDTLVDDVIHKERRINRLHKSTATLFRCDDPSAIAIAYSYQEMNRIVKDYRYQPGNHFHAIPYWLNNNAGKNQCFSFS